MQRRIERVKSTDAREATDFRVLSNEELNAWKTITALYQCNIQCNTIIESLTASIKEEIIQEDILILSMMGTFDIGELS